MASGRSVAVLGCGWFGLPLAKRLCEKGYAVRGSTTDPAKTGLIAGAGAEPFVVRLEPGKDAGAEEFFSSEVVVVNFPPKRGGDVAARLAGQMRALVNALRRGGAEFAVFVSSTSVYADLGRVVTEGDAAAGTPSKPSGAALREAERTITGARGFDATVLRFGGLIGYDRDPREFLKRREARRRPDAPVNLIHRDDCVNITELVIERDIRGEIFNAVADLHPMRSEFYAAEAEKAGVPPPPPGERGAGKTVSSEKLKRALGYRFTRLGA